MDQNEMRNLYRGPSIDAFYKCTKFHIIWQSSFRGKAVLEIDQYETRIVYDGHVAQPNEPLVLRWEGGGCQILHFSVINYVVTITIVLCNVNRSGSDYILFFIETQWEEQV
jgi:hypothetical protein